MNLKTTVAVFGILGVLGGCADTNVSFDDGGVGNECKAGETECAAFNTYRKCVNGYWSDESCGDKVCVAGKGCLTCAPETKYCKGQDGYSCNADGTVETKIATCKPEQQCVMGTCMDLCDMQEKNRSNVGCEFWAVDLPNEYSCQSIDQGKTCMIYNCAACQQFAVAVANTSTYNVLVTVEINEAAPGQPLKLKTVGQQTVKGESLEVLNLPMREVDCSTWYTDSQGKLRREKDSYSCLTSRAFRITTNYPVVAYQFNPIVNQFSNGASLLIPTNGLDTSYYIIGWGTSNPVAITMPGFNWLEGIPDYTNVTVIGVEDNTSVDVTVSHKTQASPDGAIKAANKGDTLTHKLNAFDVLNINSFQDTLDNMQNITGDLTGTRVTSDKPVAVFFGTQRASVPDNINSYKPVPPQPAGTADNCCTEHFEQQMFPITSLGKEFVITRTPVRSTSSMFPEPDFYRILATKDNTKIVTNLADFPTFVLNTGQLARFWSTTGFTVKASEPIIIAQYAVAQEYVGNYDVGGDPEFVVFPPVEQYRSDYLFLTPPTFTKDYVVIGAAHGTTVDLDGINVSDEFQTLCKVYELGKLGAKDYFSMHCPVADGVHRLKASMPVGIMVYGYYGVGSYGYPGGADVKQINLE